MSWRAPFWLYAVAAAVVPFALLALHEPPRSPRPDRRAVASGQPQQRATWPILGVYALALVATIAFYLAPTQLPFLLTSFDAGPALTGVVIAGSTLTSAAGALVFPSLRRRLTATTITTASVALLGAGWLLVGTAGSLAQVVAGLLVGGVGVGLAVPNLNLQLSELAPPDQRGRILSGLVTGVFLGQFLSPLVVQPLVQTTGIAGAFTWIGVALALGAAVAAVGSRTRHTTGD